MSDPPSSASRAVAELAGQAYALWQDDRLGEAAAIYAQVLQRAPADALALADYHAEYAAVLEGLGELADAERQLRSALALESARALDGDEIGVVIARYFLADFLLRHGHPQRALDELGPQLGAAAHGQWLLQLVAAEAWLALGDGEATEQAARRALRAAPSDDKRSELRLRLLEAGLFVDEP